MLNGITDIIKIEDNQKELLDALTANYKNALTTNGAYKSQALYAAIEFKDNFAFLRDILADLYDNWAEAKQYTSNCTHGNVSDESQYFISFTAPNLDIPKLITAIADASAQDIWPDNILYYVGINSILFCIIYTD